MESPSLYLRSVASAIGTAVIATLVVFLTAGAGMALRVGAVVLIVALVLAVIVARSVVSPMAELGEDLRAIGRGDDPNARCREKGPSELRQLARMINRLAGRLEEIRIDRDRANAKLAAQVRQETRYLEQSNRALIDLASRDPLTGLSNRRRLETELERQIALSKEIRRPLAVIMLDLDRFKQYNDTVGHLAGDKLLRTVADTLRSRTRVTDLVVRWGGDEFCILIACADVGGAVAAAEGLVDAVGSAIRSLPQSELVDMLGASAGVACFPEDAHNASDLIKRADEALYRVKEGGRGHALRYAG